MADLKYSKSHEWIAEEGGLHVIGISDYAQHSLGDIVFINLPEVDDEVTVGDAFGDIESVKAVSDVLSPVTGIVAEINESLFDAPETINEDPYGSWLIKVRDVTETEELLTSDEYDAFVESEEA
nr:glycine cleavage system protein GcvH [uncultured Mogibacterium sp.]